MSNAARHPKTETIAAYAAGRLDEARGIVIATHAARCAECRNAIRDFETLGGSCLEAMAAAPMSEVAFDSLWLRAGAQERASAPAPVSSIAANDMPVAAAYPLSHYLKDGLDGVQWRSVAPGLSQHVLPARGYRKGVLRLLKISPGFKVPRHTHGDEELTLILRGAYDDEIGRFAEGDLADLDDSTTHAPVAVGSEACICLVATSAPLVFKGLVGKVVQPFFRL